MYLLINLDHSLVEHILELDLQVKDARPGLVANIQQVFEPFCGDQGRSFPFTLKQCVGSHLSKDLSLATLGFSHICGIGWFMQPHMRYRSGMACQKQIPDVYDACKVGHQDLWCLYLCSGTCDMAVGA